MFRCFGVRLIDEGVVGLFSGFFIKLEDDEGALFFPSSLSSSSPSSSLRDKKHHSRLEFALICSVNS